MTKFISPRSRVVLRVALSGCVVALAACGGEADDADPPTPGGADRDTAANAEVVRIVDGDTLVADFDGREDRVRLIGIDTPESVIPDTPPECFGPEASEHLAELVPPGTAIRVERDAEARDRFDRLLGYVFRASDDTFVNLVMASDGYAEVLSIPPNITHADAFNAAVATAREAGRGLWSAC